MNSNQLIALPEVPMNASALIAGRMYVWDITGTFDSARKIIVKLNERQDGLIDLSRDNEEWFFDHDLIGKHGFLIMILSVNSTARSSCEGIVKKYSMNPSFLGVDFDSPPDFVNEIGTKFWLDKACTEYAREENLNGITLPDIVVFLVEETGGQRTRLIVNNKLRQIIHQNSNFEAICVYIDMLKANVSFDRAEGKPKK